MVDILDTQRDFTAQNQAPEDRGGDGVFATLGASLRQSTTLGSAFSRERTRGVLDPSTSIDKLVTQADLDALPARYQPFRDTFIGLNREDMAAQRRNLDQELRDRDTLARAGALGGFLSDVAVQFVDPVNYLPIANTTFRGVNLATKLRRGAQSGVAGAALQEPVLLATQDTRTTNEALANVAASAVFGAAIGAAAHGVERAFSRGFFADIEPSPEARAMTPTEDVIQFGQTLRGQVESQLVSVGRDAEEARLSADVFARGVESVLADIPDAEARAGVMAQIDVDIQAGRAADPAAGRNVDVASEQTAPPQPSEAVPVQSGPNIPSRMPSGSRPNMDRPRSLTQFVIDHGGINGADHAEELTQLGLRNRPGLVRRAETKELPSGTVPVGRLLDDLRSSAAELGYLPDDSTVADFLDALGRDNGGDRVYAVSDMLAADAWREYDEAKAILDRARDDPDFAASYFNSNDPRFLYQGERGSIELPDRGVLEGKTVIRLMQDEGADASTFIHEAAHFFAAMLEDVHAKLGDDSPLQGRVDAVRKEFGDMATVEGQEKFAAGFEQYLRTGKAPVPELRKLFERFREWLVSIYARSDQLGVQLTPEMARIYDELMVPDLGQVEGPYGVSVPQSVGAAAAGDALVSDGEGGYRALGLDDFSLRNRAAKVVERTGLNLTPNARISKSPLVSMRRLFANMVEDTRDTNAVREGAVGDAIETRIKVDRDQATAELVRILGKHGKRFNHPDLDRDTFGQRVLDAIANPSDESDEIVLTVANQLHTRVLKPLEDKMRGIGMLAEAQKWKRDERYSPHNWSSRRIYERLAEFRERMGARVSDSLREQYEIEKNRLNERLASTYRGIDQLELAAERRNEELRRRFAGGEVDISEEELRGLLMQAQNTPDDKRPKSLLSWITDQGGVWLGDALAPDVRAMEYRRPGFVKRARFERSSAGDNGGGRMLDELREMAVEAGYIEEGATLSDFLDVMRDEVGGNRRYATEDIDTVMAWEQYDEFIAALGEMGIDPSGRKVLRKTTDDQKALMQRTADALAAIEATRAQKARARADELDAQIAEIDGLLNDGEAYRSEVNTILESVISKLTGEESLQVDDLDLEIVMPGSLKRRSIDVKRSDFSDFMSQNPFEAIASHVYRLTGEYHLNRAFGDATLKHDIASVIEEARVLKEDMTGPEREAFQKQLESHLRLVRVSRDKMRGTFESQFTGAANAGARALSGLAYVVQLGGVTVSSLADAARPVMTHQLSLLMRFGLPRLREGLKAAFRNLDGDDYFKSDRFGVVVERIANTRLAAMMELDENYLPTSRAERVTQNLGRWATTFSLMDRWNEMGKTLVTGLYMDRLGSMSGKDWDALTDGDRAYLSLQRIGRNAWNAARLQIQEHADMETGVWRLNLNAWPDQQLAALVRSGMRKEADSLVVTPSIGDRVQDIGGANGQNMAGPIGRLLLQYKNFWISAHEKIVLRAAQNPDKVQVASGAAAMVVMGMMIDEIKEWGRDPEYDLQERLADVNIGTRIMGGLDRSGVIPLWMEVNNMVEKMTPVPGAYEIASGVARALGDDGAARTSSRYQNRNAWGSLAGPALGMLPDLSQVANDVGREVRGADEGVTGATVNAAVRVMPFHNVPVFREMLNWYAKPALRAAVE